MRNRVLSRVAICGFALTIPMNALSAAYAAPENQPHSTTQAVDEEQRQQTLIKEARDLEASDIPRHTVTQDGEDFLVYELNTGVNLAMPAALTRPSPYVSAGPALRGPWIELTSTEQKMVAGGQLDSLPPLYAEAPSGSPAEPHLLSPAQPSHTLETKEYVLTINVCLSNIHGALPSAELSAGRNYE